MNKGIIMEKHRNYNIVLTRDGSFKKVKVTKEDNVIGEEIKFEPYISKNFFNKDIKLPATMKLGSIAALIAVFIFFCFSFLEGNETYAYITVDVNPSIQIEVDDLLRVQNISALNEDAEILLQEFSNNQHEDLELVIEEIIYKSEKQNMTNEEKNMLVGVSYIDETKKKIINDIDQYFNRKSTDWEIITFNVPSGVREKAIENQTSMNKEFAILISDMNNRYKEKINIDEKQRKSITSFYNISSENEELDIREKATESNLQSEEVKEKSGWSSSIKTEAPKRNIITNKSANKNETKSNNNVHEDVKKELSQVEMKKKSDKDNFQSENIKVKAKGKEKAQVSKTKNNEIKKVPRKQKQQNPEKYNKEHHKNNTDKELKDKHNKHPDKHKKIEKKHKQHNKANKPKDKDSKGNHGKSEKEKERNPR